MKKGLLIIGGVSILVILVAVWLYLLFFGTPKDAGDVFANLGFTEERDRTPLPEDEETTEDTEVKKLPKQALRQLTFRPTAGVYVPEGLFPKWIRFAEKGTGHVYEIDLATGVESPVTQYTVPQTAEARFAPDGSSIAYTSFVDGTRTSVVAVLATTTGSSTTEVTKTLPLPPGVDNLSYDDADSLLYTLSDETGTIGYRFSISSQTRAEIFRIPMTQITMVWGDGLDSIYLYTKPSRYLEGYAYEVVDAKLERIGKGANGLTYTRNNTIAITTTADLKDIKTSYTYATNTIPAALPFLPEKCDFVDKNSNTFWCAASVEKIDPGFPEAWYAGSKTSNDGLWLVDAATGVADQRIEFKVASGRVVDATSLTATEDGFSVFFQNKLDSTVWLYDTLAELEEEVKP